MAIRLGIIGTGNYARHRHIPAARQCTAIELTALCDPNSDNLRKAQELAGADMATFSHVDQLLISHLVDAVVIATPNCNHRDIVLRCAEAGLHMVCEKPLAMNYAEAQTMLASVTARNLVALVDFGYRLQPWAAAIHHAIHSGTLGHINEAVMVYGQGWLQEPDGFAGDKRERRIWRLDRQQAGSGALGDLGSHLLDLARWWLGDVRRVFGKTFTCTRWDHVAGATSAGVVDVDDSCTIVMDMNCGARVTLVSSRLFCGRSNYQRCEIFGAKGAIRYDNIYAPHLEIGTPEGQWQPWRALAATPYPSIVHLLAARIADAAVDAPTFADGAAVQMVMDTVLG